MLAIVSAGVTVFRTSKQMKQVSEYIKENAPEFKYSDGILDIDINEPIINENENFGKIIVDTISETEDIQNQYMDDIKKEKRAVVVLKDKLILKETENNIVYKYEELFKELNISEFSKDDLASYLVSSVMMPLYLNLFLVLFIYEEGFPFSSFPHIPSSVKIYQTNDEINITIIIIGINIFDIFFKLPFIIFTI